MTSQPTEMLAPETLIPEAPSPPAWHLPMWLVQPMDMASPLAAAAALNQQQRLEVFALVLGLDPQAITEKELADIEAEFASDKRVLAVAQARGIRSAGELRVLSDRILQVMAAQATVSPLYAYHPEKYPSVAALLQGQLAELQTDHPGGSEWNDLDWIANTFVPLCAAAGLNGYEELWQPGTLAKTRLLAGYMRSPMAAAGIDKKAVATAAEEGRPLPVPPKIAKRIETMLTDTVDRKLSVSQFREKHGVGHHADNGRGKLAAYHYNLPRGGATLIFWSSEADRIHLEQAVHADFKLGTAAEIKRLSAPAPKKKAKARRAVPKKRK